MRIDSHHHFWHYSPEAHDWIDESMSAIKADFLPPDLELLQKNLGFDGAVTVQVQQNLEENDYLLDLASQSEHIKGVVGWVDLRDNNVDEALEKYSDHPLYVGVRHIVQGEADGFMLDDSFLNGIGRLKHYELTYDILIYARQLAEATEFASRFPDQPFVIDHIAKPDIKNKKFAEWDEQIRRIAELENCYCKLSGMVTEADWDNWAKSDFYPYIDTVLEVFGPERLMIGSDWPVCLLGGSYESVMSIVIDYISGLSEDEQNLILGDSCRKFYLS